jgi:hypothetical protein
LRKHHQLIRSRRHQSRWARKRLMV